MMKHCPSCNETKSLDSFYTHIRKDRGNRVQVRPYCKACLNAKSREWAHNNPEKVRANTAASRAKRQPKRSREENKRETLRKYGITPEQFNIILEHQNRVCAICKNPPTNNKSLHVDHCHATGTVRGLLCFRCNTALGGFDDNPARLSAAIEYLRTTPILPHE